MKRCLLCIVCLALFSCSSKDQKTLYLFSWSGFFSPDLIRKFEKTYDCRVVIDTYDSNESMYAKLKLGGAGYDIIFPSNYYLGILYSQGIIKPIDESKIPNLELLDPTYFQKTDSLVGVPFTVSFSGIAYRTDRIAIPDPSWDVFARKDLRGRMTMLNDIREAIGAALKYNGYSINTKDPKALKIAGDTLLEWKKNLAKFESEQYKNGLATAEFLLVQGYSIDVIQIREEDQNIDFLFPKEGAILSIDYLAILKNAKETELAYAFVNFMLNKDNAAENMDYSKSLIPITDSYELLDPELQQSPVLFPSKEDLEKMELIEDLGDGIKLYYDTWERVKGG